MSKKKKKIKVVNFLNSNFFSSAYCLTLKMLLVLLFFPSLFNNIPKSEEPVEAKNLVLLLGALHCKAVFCSLKEAGS